MTLVQTGGRRGGPGPRQEDDRAAGEKVRRSGEQKERSGKGADRGEKGTTGGCGKAQEQVSS